MHDFAIDRHILKRAPPAAQGDAVHRLIDHHVTDRIILSADANCHIKLFRVIDVAAAAIGCGSDATNLRKTAGRIIFTTAVPGGFKYFASNESKSGTSNVIVLVKTAATRALDGDKRSGAQPRLLLAVAGQIVHAHELDPRRRDGSPNLITSPSKSLARRRRGSSSSRMEHTHR